MDRLAKSDPGNAGWQRDLSVSYNKIGNVQKAQGDLAGALKFYRGQPHDHCDRLANIRPRQRGAGSAICRWSDRKDWRRANSAQGDLASALKSYQDSLAIFDRLAKSDPGNAEWQRGLSVSYERIGDVQVAQGDLAGALKSYQDDLAIIDRLAKSDPGNAGWQRDLAVSFDKLALVHKQSGDKAKALDFFRQGQAIMARLTKLSPDNAQWKKDLAWINQQIGELAASRLEHGRNPRTPLSRR